MIIGIGNDIVDIRRIEKVLERHGERFITRIFTEVERERAERKANAHRDLCQEVRRQGGLLQGAGHRHARRGVVARHGVVNLPSGRRP